MLPLDLDRGKIVDRLVEPFCELNCRHEFWRNQTKPTYIIDIDPTLFFSVHIIILGVSIFFIHVFIFVCLVYIKKKEYVKIYECWKENAWNGYRAARDAEVDPAQKFSFPAGSGHWNVVLPVHAVASRGFEIPGIKLGLKPGKCEFEMLPPDVRGPDLPSA